MIKIHNKIQNIESRGSNRGLCGPIIIEIIGSGQFFVVGVSKSLKVICLSKI